MNRLNLILLVLITTLSGCLQEEMNNSIIPEVKSGLLSQNLHSHTFELLSVQTLLNNSETHHFRFEIAQSGLSELNVECVAINASLQEVGRTTGTIGQIGIDMSSLNSMTPLSSEAIERGGKVLSEHIIQPQTAHDFIDDWNTVLNAGSPIAPYMVYGNETIQYYLVEKEILINIIEGVETSGVSIFWGLNDQDKLTPVFMGYDVNNQAIIESSVSTGYILDTVRPVPPFGQDALL